METPFEIFVSPHTGLTQARVRSDLMWQLVEYLALRRSRVTYTYEASHFTVCFLTLGRKGVEALFDDWLHSEAQITVPEHLIAPAQA